MPTPFHLPGNQVLDVDFLWRRRSDHIEDFIAKVIEIDRLLALHFHLILNWLSKWTSQESVEKVCA